MKPEKNRIVGLVFWLLICFCAAAIGAVASVHANTFYGQLVKPDWAPPGWLFGPVWSVLYAMMAIAAWQVWSLRGWQGANYALTLFCAQLTLNALWSWLFFYFHSGAMAFFDIILLWWLILATLLRFWRIKPLAGALLIPYLIWVTFAAKLNLTMWQLNPTLLW